MVWAVVALVVDALFLIVVGFIDFCLIRFQLPSESVGEGKYSLYSGLIGGNLAAIAAALRVFSLWASPPVPTSGISEAVRVIAVLALLALLPALWIRIGRFIQSQRQ